MKTVTMWRPTGPNELALVEASGFRRWPPRLPEQPIFYPVTNEAYAIEIASRWNVRDSGQGFVTRSLAMFRLSRFLRTSRLLERDDIRACLAFAAHSSHIPPHPAHPR